MSEQTEKGLQTSFRRNAQSRGKTIFVASLCVAAATLLSFAGCQDKKAASTAGPTAPNKSVIEAKVTAEGVVVRTPQAEFTLSPSGTLNAALVKTGAPVTLDKKAADAGQSVFLKGNEYAGVVLDTAKATVREATGKFGSLGKQIEVTGKIPGSGLEETVTLEVYDAFPNLALLSAQLKNAGQADAALDTVVLQRHSFASPQPANGAAEPLWTFEGSSLKWGKDEIFPMPAKFSQVNPFGAPVVVKDDLGQVGGGIPVVAFWSRSVGEAIGHIETLPLVLSIPVQTTADGRVEAGISIPAKTILKPGEVYSTPRTFLAVYSGDFYEPLKMWSDAIDREGLSKPANNDENYAVAWCGWGYEFGVTPKQMLDTIPKLKEFGIHWATLDDGWFNNYGDWQPRQADFGGTAMQDMVKQFHEQGIRVQLWWLPLGVEDGKFAYGGRKFVISEVLKQHPDWLVLDQNGKPARMARNLATLCPALPEVQAYYKQLTERFVRDWGFDGHKLDNIYTPPPCFNPKHHHKSPYDSIYAMGDVYKAIFETTRALKPDSVTQSCPCGTPPSLAWFRYMDQAVTADPVGSIQVRRRIKMYKALLGPHAAVYGDHVELTRITGTFTDHEQDMGKDFASTLGAGGVLGTKFTWPDYGPKFRNVYLSADKEAHWKEWIALYNEKMLSKGNFLNLYVYGFDSPEAYAIEKDGHIYYAFYAPASAEKARKGQEETSHWSGEVELRGLGAKSYRVTDYVHHKDLESVTGPTAKLKVEFTDNLLLEASPAL
ncbi:MAG TPA: glycoside hydrolase family 36 protein [Candidatus Limnocylindrales bacterium]|nr:glycoside hydrolase family 36 protein [Candidatus Limnocylindrales bacterium]